MLFKLAFVFDAKPSLQTCMDKKLQCTKTLNECPCTCAELRVYMLPFWLTPHTHHMTWFRYTGTDIKDLAPNKQSN